MISGLRVIGCNNNVGDCIAVRQCQLARCFIRGGGTEWGGMRAVSW